MCVCVCVCIYTYGGGIIWTRTFIFFCFLGDLAAYVSLGEPHHHHRQGQAAARLHTDRAQPASCLVSPRGYGVANTARKDAGELFILVISGLTLHSFFKPDSACRQSLSIMWTRSGWRDWKRCRWVIYSLHELPLCWCVCTVCGLCVTCSWSLCNPRLCFFNRTRPSSGLLSPRGHGMAGATWAHAGQLSISIYIYIG